MSNSGMHKIAYITSGIFFLLFVVYSFWSVEHINSEPTMVGPIFRSLVVGAWLAIIFLVSRRYWDDNGHIGFMIGLIPAVIILLMSVFNNGKYNDLSYFRVGFFVFSYIYIAALSTITVKNFFLKIFMWPAVIFSQVVVDFLMAGTGLYGEFPSFHI